MTESISVAFLHIQCASATQNRRGNQMNSDFKISSSLIIDALVFECSQLSTFLNHIDNHDLLEQYNEAIAYVDMSGNVVRANKQFHEQLAEHTEPFLFSSF